MRFEQGETLITRKRKHQSIVNVLSLTYRNLRPTLLPSYYNLHHLPIPRMVWILLLAFQSKYEQRHLLSSLASHPIIFLAYYPYTYLLKIENYFLFQLNQREIAVLNGKLVKTIAVFNDVVPLNHPSL